jgi:2-alkenal reductase
VIGVTSAIESSSGANAGIGFAIPVNLVQRIVPELIKNGSYNHVWLGISGVTLSSAMANEMGLPDNQRGILVGTITPGSPADKAGLKGSEKQATINGTTCRGDIVAIDGQRSNALAISSPSAKMAPLVRRSSRYPEQWQAKR